MSKTTTQIPFTEIIERSIEIARLREEVKFKARGMANDVYCREIPRKEDWTFFMTRTSLTINPAYSTGYATVNSGDTAVTFTSATIPSTANGSRITFGNNNYIYNFTYVSSSNGTISPSLVGDKNIAGGAYQIYQNVFDLPKDFDRFPKNGGIHIYSGGRMRVVPERNYDYYVDEFSPSPNDSTDFCRVTGYSASGRRQVEVIPPPKTSGSIEADYLRIVQPMKENTAGTVSITAGATAVVGVGTKFTSMTSGDYLRVDGFGTSGDSEWYRIASIAGDTTLTLDLAFGTSSASASKYTISSVPQTPESMHVGIMYGVVEKISTDQNDPMTASYKQQYADVLTDGKKVYRTRLIRQDIPHIGEDSEYRR